jgi:glycosyltransferase involved in cell wall biosynthesis
MTAADIPSLSAPPATLSPPIEPDIESADPVSAAVLEGWRLGNVERRASKSSSEQARQTFDEARRGIEPERATDTLLQYIRDYPAEERFQVFAARLFEMRDHPAATEIWARLLDRFPRSPHVVIETVRRTLVHFGPQRAYRLVYEMFPTEPNDPEQLLLYARLLDELKDLDAAEAAMERLLTFEGLTANQIFAAANFYERRAELLRARQIARDAQDRFGRSERFDKLLRRLDKSIAGLSAVFPDINLQGGRIADSIFNFALQRFAETRDSVEEMPESFIGSILLLGGSLSVGGAERQFTNTALALAKAIRDGERVADVNVVGPLQVICRVLFNRPGADFFLPDLEAADIPVEQYVNYPNFGGRMKRSLALGLEPILQYLPATAAEATRKLADVLGVLSPQVINIWQDGMILAGALAALIARIPRIVLSVRSVPPIDRPDRNRPEFETLYRAVLKMPGVRLTANSRAAASRYAEWLEIDPDRIAVIYNGVVPLTTECDDDTAELEAAFFANATSDDFIVGTVMRFDENKRPFLWIEAANEIAKSEPRARFVLVGEGPLKEPARELAQRFGIADRCLFVGRSRHVGRWLSHMSVFLLLSRKEGLPNVLIEAQFAGVPVVSAPAGGAAETFIDGQTGTLLPDGPSVDPALVGRAVLGWDRGLAERAEIRARAIAWAESQFSVARMLESTIRAYYE